MKPRNIFIGVILLGIGAAIAWWLIQPGQPAPPSMGKMAANPIVPKPVVEAPRAPAAPATNLPANTADGKTPAHSPTPIVINAAAKQANGVLDFGEVRFADGVPVLLVLDSGRLLKANPSLLPNGKLQLDMNIAGVDGKAIWESKATFSKDQPTTYWVIGVANDSIAFTPKWEKINP